MQYLLEWWCCFICHPNKPTFLSASKLSQLPCTGPYSSFLFLYLCYISHCRSLPSLRAFSSCSYLQFDHYLKIWHFWNSPEVLFRKKKKTKTLLYPVYRKQILIWSYFQELSIFLFILSGSCIEKRSLRQLCILNHSKPNTCWPDQQLHCKSIKATYSSLCVITITAHCWVISSINFKKYKFTNTSSSSILGATKRWW